MEEQRRDFSTASARAKSPTIGLPRVVCTGSSCPVVPRVGVLIPHEVSGSELG